MKLNNKILKGLKQAQDSVMIPEKWENHQNMINDIADILKLDKEIVETFLISVAFGFNNSVKPADVVKAVKTNMMDWSNELKLAVFPDSVFDFIFKDKGKVYNQIIETIDNGNYIMEARDLIKRTANYADIMHYIVKAFIVECWNKIIKEYPNLEIK